MAGYVCGTCCQGSELTHESMTEHDASGQTLCIHSVVVSDKFRRRGYATALLRYLMYRIAYIERIAVTQPGVKRMCLIAKSDLLGLYASCGFSTKGLSPIVLGKDPWFEMCIELDSTEPRLLRFLQVDAFTERAFSGNPAAVFFTHASGDEGWMQKVAIEMNLSKHASWSCYPAGAQGTEPEPTYALRWFTPGGEVALCGHATLAAAHALLEEGRVHSGVPIRFSTASGVLTCRRDEQGWISMDFPAEPLETRSMQRTAVAKDRGSLMSWAGERAVRRS
ncbi:unnamed protein product [Ascophyllum nodosum]